MRFSLQMPELSFWNCWCTMRGCNLFAPTSQPVVQRLAAGCRFCDSAGEKRTPEAFRRAGDSVMEPSFPVIRGRTPPRSSRLVNKHRPLPSQNRTLTICARLP